VRSIALAKGLRGHDDGGIMARSNRDELARHRRCNTAAFVLREGELAYLDAAVDRP
jgi:hypothetical protein